MPTSRVGTTDNPMKLAKVNIPSLSILSCSFLIAVVIAELVLRSFSPLWLSQRMEILNAGDSLAKIGSDREWPVLKKGGQLTKFVPFSHFQVVHYEYNMQANINRWGGRETESCRKRRLRQIVPFLGDSFTFGVGAGDDETYVNILGNKLGLCFLNLGVPGVGLEDELEIIRARHSELGSPKLYVINFFLGNDFTFHDTKENPVSSQNESREFRFGERMICRLNEINKVVYQHPILKRIYLIQLVRQGVLSAYNAYAIRRGDTLLVDPIFLWMRKDEIFLREAQVNTRKAIDDLSTLSHELGFNVLFVIVPDRHQINSKYLENKSKYYGFLIRDLDPDLPAVKLKEILEEKHIPYIDPTECMRKSEESLFYIQDNHLNLQGHRKIADCIAPKLKVYLDLEGDQGLSEFFSLDKER